MSQQMDNIPFTPGKFKSEKYHYIHRFKLKPINSNKKMKIESGETYLWERLNLPILYGVRRRMDVSAQIWACSCTLLAIILILLSLSPSLPLKHWMNKWINKWKNQWSMKYELWDIQMSFKLEYNMLKYKGVLEPIYRGRREEEEEEEEK